MRGPKRHLKRLHAPSSWLLCKKTGKYAPRPSQGPHKLRECIPLVVILRNKLNYAANGAEAKKITNQRNIKVDGRVRTDHKYPLGFMDVIEIEKTGDIFRVMYDVKGRFVFNRIDHAEARYKLCNVKRLGTGKKGVPYVGTHDGRTIRYPHPEIRMHDTVKYDLESCKIVEHVKLRIGCLVMVVGGVNIGRVGTVIGKDKHPGGFDIIKIKDARDNAFATRISNVFVIGEEAPMVKLPGGDGIKLSLTEDFELRMKKNAK